MYKIIGADQKEYGPITSDQIRQWIADGRVGAQSRAKAIDGIEWQTLGDFPEFSDLFAVHATESHPGSLPPPPPAPAKTSGMAVTSLVMGILGLFTCGLTGLIGLVLGIVSASRIKKSGGQLKGSGIALAGIIVSGLFMLIIPLLAAMLFPALASAKQRAQIIVCVNNLKQLEVAVQIYANNHTNQLPSAKTWCDALQPYANKESAFACPADLPNRGHRSCSYAFNSRLSELETDKIDPNTVILFESTGGWNLTGGRELLLSPPRHAHRLVVAFADGSVRQVTESEIGTLRWDP